MKKLNSNHIARLEALKAIAKRSAVSTDGDQYLQRLRTDIGGPLSGWTNEEIADLDEALTKAQEQCGDFDSVGESIEAISDLAAEFAKSPKVQHWLKPKRQLPGKVKVSSVEEVE